MRFLGDLADGAFSVEPVAAADWLRIAELVARYRDLPLGTVDGRHFTVVRPNHVKAFTLMP